MASKLSLRKLETQRSGIFLKKAFCSGYVITTSLLLACSAAAFLLCFMFADVRTFYGNSNSEDAVVLQRGLDTTSMNSQGSEEGTASRPLSEVTLEAKRGEAEVDSEAEAEETKISLAEPLESSTGPDSDDAEAEAEEKGSLAKPLESSTGRDSDDSEAEEKDSLAEPLESSTGPDSDDSEAEEKDSLPEPLELSTGSDSNDSAVVSEEAHDSGLNEESIRSDTNTSKDDDSQYEAELDLPVKGTENRYRRPLPGCDISQGKWVYDETYPLYRSKNCPFADPGFRCEENGRPDKDFMKYRWQPRDCDLPRFDPKDMLERLRNQRLVFVGDSLGRNQWESMLCMLAEGVKNKSRIYEINGETICKHVGELIFRFQDYNCTVEYYRDPFLVPQTRPPPHSPKNVTSSLKIDQVSWSARRWPGANILVFNSGHWWSWEKIERPGGRFQVGNTLTTHSFKEAFQISLNTWAKWMEKNIDPATTQVFFRSYASVHFRGGTWNTGGYCHEEVKPLTDEEVKEMQTIPWTNKYIVDAINRNIKKKRRAVEFMDVTKATDYRSDGHSGLYYNDIKVMGPTPINRQDCSHFCLPGVPDTWNEFLYATLLARGQGVWGKPKTE